MKLVVTGGGTGGHIYPALEVALLARQNHADVMYAGSFRGQEQSLSGLRNFPFQGFHSAPLYSLREARGWKSLAHLLRATLQAKTWLKETRPDVVFSTGGFSAAPLMSAAKSSRIPLVIHESNSVPGRSNRMFARYCSSFTCAFHATRQMISSAIRTGQPIRQELRAAATTKGMDLRPNSHVLALGGSQGSVFINDLVERAASLETNRFEWLAAVGRANRQPTQVPCLVKVPYLETAELAEAYSSAIVVVARSGGTLAEIAMFGLPSVLIPLPTAADDHQTKNAEEFVGLRAASLLRQPDATPQKLIDEVRHWSEDSAARQAASESLRAWDNPEATSSILRLVMTAAAG
jgi:UDP-N-acetylglucosamine--N-acetylmuramyl-(pentapeptide) pyrophosphoryl-undecaprenol N-acetylglucosamine transferase